MFACYPHTMKELALNAEEPFLRSTFLECWRTSKMAFDIKQYMENRNDYLEYLYIGVLRKDPFCEDIISRFNSEIGCIFKMKVVCKKLFSMCKNKILK